MFAIFQKELRGFFNSPVGYLVVALFLLLNGLFLWVFRQGFNIFDYGFADLSNFFLLIPWVFLFLVPALCMRSLSEEMKLGTLELLFIKPVTKIQIVLGKFLAVLSVGIIALLPTIIYVFAISDLGMVTANYDSGLVLGSYFGAVFLLALYCGIGIWVSSLSENQIFAFVLSAAFCFLVYYGPEAMASLFQDGAQQLLIKSIGAKAHYENIAKGVLDTRNLIYFGSLTCFFLFLAQQSLLKSRSKS